jgi:actin-like ATPase involved in cell morphogenesis
MSASNDGIRRHPRFSTPWAVRLRAPDWTDALQLATGNISRGGLFVRCETAIPIGTRLQIVISLPEEMSLEVEGEVVHAIPPERARAQGLAAGIGIRFDERSAIDLNLLEGMAASNSAGQYAAPVEDQYLTWAAVLADRASGHELSTTAHKLFETTAPAAVGEGEGEAALTFAPDEPTPPDASKTRDLSREPIFGIDFGTTFTSIALVERGRVRVLPDENQQTSLPSVVCYPDEGPPLVGWPAREQIALQPSTTILSPKRLIGRRFRDPGLAAYLASSPVRFLEAPAGQVLLEVYGEQLSVEQVGAEIFQRIAAIGEAATMRPVRRVVLSAPVSYTDERQALRRSAELAGLEVVAFIDEPVSAALAFGMNVERGSTVAVYDFGGGTFDFTLLKMTGHGTCEVIGEAGDPWLGGDDFDQAIAAHAAEQFRERHGVDLRERKVEWQRLMFAAQNAKRKLSVEKAVELSVRAIVLSLRGTIDLYLLLDRELLAALCGELVERSFAAVAQCLELAELTPKEIDHVVLTGGTSRSPLVRQRAQQFFGKEITVNYDPELGVVSGNAIFGQILRSR